MGLRETNWLSDNYYYDNNNKQTNKTTTTTTTTTISCGGRSAYTGELTHIPIKTLLPFTGGIQFVATVRIPPIPGSPAQCRTATISLHGRNSILADVVLIRLTQEDDDISPGGHAGLRVETSLLVSGLKPAYWSQG